VFEFEPQTPSALAHIELANVPSQEATKESGRNRAIKWRKEHWLMQLCGFQTTPVSAEIPKKDRSQMDCDFQFETSHVILPLGTD
jgi:hypothetical protein